MENENSFFDPNLWVFVPRMSVSAWYFNSICNNFSNFISDFDLENQCKEICHEDTIECISNCTTPDSTCISICSREEIACFDSCPCESDCPLGCSECDHPICETKRESVLVLRAVSEML